MIDISTIVKSINKETTIETELTLTSFESDGTFGRSETMRCDCGSTGDAAGDIGVRRTGSRT